MDMFKMMKEAAAMKSRLETMERTLKAKTAVVEEHGVSVTVNAKSEIVNLAISTDLVAQGAEKIQKTVLSVIQSAQKKAHTMMMEEAKAITGGMKIPGLM